MDQIIKENNKNLYRYDAPPMKSNDEGATLQ